MGHHLIIILQIIVCYISDWQPYTEKLIGLVKFVGRVDRNVIQNM